MPNMNGIDAVFQRLLSGHQILITDGWTDARTDGRTQAGTGVTLNAPPPFFEWRGHKKLILFTVVIHKDRSKCLFVIHYRSHQSCLVGKYVLNMQ